MQRVPYIAREALWFISGCCLIGAGIAAIASVWNGRVP